MAHGSTSRALHRRDARRLHRRVGGGEDGRPSRQVDGEADASPSSSSHHDEQKFAGGAPANVACALAKLGTPAGFIGTIGDDEDGEMLKRVREAGGVRSLLTLRRRLRNVKCRCA